MVSRRCQDWQTLTKIFGFGCFLREPSWSWLLTILQIATTQERAAFPVAQTDSRERLAVPSALFEVILESSDNINDGCSNLLVDSCDLFQAKNLAKPE
jgi:hypothetical protein